MRRVTAFVIAAAAWTGFIGQYFFSNAGKTGAALATSTLNYFSYFTTLSNLFIAAALTAVLVVPTSRVGRFFGGPRGATPLAFYITITGIVFWLLLRDTTHPEGLGIGLNAIHHYVVPITYPLWWLLFVRKGELRLQNVIDWMIFPALYALYTILHGQESAWYPYGFVDVTKLGLDRVIQSMVKFGIEFAILGCLYVLVDAIIGYVDWRRQPKEAAPATVATEAAPASPAT
ncbi:MAG: Pr6Pr family membrane protein [Rhizobiales bacterium]|nr:Pr6Pr family membrane protein [Hyphomicrobiales bacterium]